MTPKSETSRATQHAAASLHWSRHQQPSVVRKCAPVKGTGNARLAPCGIWDTRRLGASGSRRESMIDERVQNCFRQCVHRRSPANVFSRIWSRSRRVRKQTLDVKVSRPRLAPGKSSKRVNEFFEYFGREFLAAPLFESFFRGRPDSAIEDIRWAMWARGVQERIQRAAASIKGREGISLARRMPTVREGAQDATRDCKARRPAAGISDPTLNERKNFEIKNDF